MPSRPSMFPKYAYLSWVKLTIQVVRVGGAGYKVLKLLDGFADFYLYPTKGTKKVSLAHPKLETDQIVGYLRPRSDLEGTWRQNV